MDDLTTDSPAEDATEPVDNTTEDAAEAPAPPPVPEGWDRDPGANLAKTLPTAFLTKLGAIVFREFETDWNSGKGWREMSAKYLELHNETMPDSLGAQENVTLVHLPYVARGVGLFHSKMFPHLYPATGDFVNLSVSRPSLETTVRRCARHMNDSLRNEVVEWLVSHDRGQKQTLIRGSSFEVWFFDPVEGRAKQEICLADEVVIPYRHKSDRVDMGDVPRITWRKRYYLHELEALEDEDYYACIRQPNRDILPLFEEDPYDEAGAPKANPAGMDNSRGDVNKEVDNRTTGSEPAADESDGTREVLEQDRWLVIKPFGEKRARAVTVCVDRDTQKVLRVTLREKDDARDAKRYERDLQVRDARMQALAAQADAAHAQATNDHGAALDLHLAQQSGGLMPGEPPQPHPGMPPQYQPPPPEPLPVPAKRVPWHRWTHYMCDVNPEGFYGHGVPQKIAGHNLLANKVGTRAVSLLTMTLLPTGVFSRQSKFARGETKIKLGQMQESPLSPQQVQDGAGMFLLKFPPPDPNWVKVIELMDSSCQQQTAFDIAQGGPGMSGETATESENRHSSALDVISMVAMRQNMARANSLKNYAYILSLTLPDEGVRVRARPQGAPTELPEPDQAAPQAGGPPPPAPAAPPPGMPPDLGMMTGPPPDVSGAAPEDDEEFTVTREDYAAIVNDLQVTFTCDPRMASRPQKIRDAQKGFQTLLQVITTTVGPGGPPILDPMSAVVIVRESAAQVMEAMDRPEVARRIRAAPMPQQPPPGMGPPSGGPGGPPRKGSNGPNGPPPGAGMDGSGPGGAEAQPPGSEDAGDLAA